MDLKDKITLYKEFYFKELSRKVELDNAINLQIIIITGVISVNTIVLSKSNGIYLKIALVLCAIAFPLFISAIFNFISTYTKKDGFYEYKELNGMDKFYLDEKEKNENGHPEYFDLYLEKEFAECAGYNFNLNVKRTELLAKGKKKLAICIIISISTSLLFVTSIIRVENFKNKLSKLKKEQIEKAKEKNNEKNNVNYHVKGKK